MGSSGPLRVLPALLAALERLPVSVVLSTSGRGVNGSAHYQAPLLPFQETAAEAHVVVSHGGSSGLYPAIAAGTPVLGIPSNADQQLSTAVLEESGAGLGIRVEEASESRLAAALQRLLSESEFRITAQQWKPKFCNYATTRQFGLFMQKALSGARRQPSAA